MLHPSFFKPAGDDKRLSLLYTFVFFDLYSYHLDPSILNPLQKWSFFTIAGARLLTTIPSIDNFVTQKYPKERNVRQLSNPVPN